jgi:hypothetical protein
LLSAGPDGRLIRAATKGVHSLTGLGYWPVSEPILNLMVGWIYFFSWIESLTAPTWRVSPGPSSSSRSLDRRLVPDHRRNGPRRARRKP